MYCNIVIVCAIGINETSFYVNKNKIIFYVNNNIMIIYVLIRHFIYWLEYHVIFKHILYKKIYSICNITFIK